jgi:hypothetical protein
VTTSHPKPETASPKNAVSVWKRTDIRSFDQLCADALRIGVPTGVGLMEDPRSHYRSIDVARAKLHAHPIYQWLRGRSKATLAAFENNSSTPVALSQPLLEFKFLRYLVRQMTLCRAVAEEPTTSPRRRDKVEDRAVRAIEHLERHMDVVSVHLINAEQGEVLRQLIGQAKASLLTIRSSGPKHPRRFLREFAIGLVREFGFVEPAILVEVSKYAGIRLKPRTAQQYCKDARGSEPAALCFC